MSNETRKLPLWKNAVEAMVASGMTYGSSWPASWFEEQLSMKSSDPRFSLEMKNITEAIKRQHSLYLKRCNHGQTYRIPTEAEWEKVCGNFARKQKKAGRHSVDLLNRILADPSAQLEVTVRLRLEKKAHTQAVRQILLSRTAQAEQLAQKFKPKLLKAG